MNQLVIGIDIGGTNTEIGLIDSEGLCIGKSRMSTDKYDDAHLFIDDLSDKLKEMLAQAGAGYELFGIGIGAPNGNYFRGTVENPPNLRWKGVIPLVEMLRWHFDTRIYLTNDANAAAIGEKIYGGARDMNDFIVITLGTGVGSGFFANGRLINGHNGFAGELGHTIYDENGRQCGCGKKGCLETYASATGIVRTVVELLEMSPRESLLRHVNPYRLKAIDIHSAAKEGDPIALEAFEITGKILGFKLADAVSMTDPEAVFLLGGLASAGDFIFKPTLKYMNAYLLPAFRNRVSLLPSGMPANEAAIFGAAALVIAESRKA